MNPSTWHLRSAFMVCLVPVVACQAPLESVEPSDPSEAPITFSVVGETPVIEPADFGADYLLPGAAVVHEGVYHLCPVAFDADPAEAPRVLHLTSNDSISWTGGASVASPNRNRIGFATSTNGVTWTKTVATLDGADDDQALGPSACGVEARTMFEPHVLTTDDGHLLMFGVMGEGRAAPMQILAATSSDGVAWTCAPGDGALGSEDFPALRRFTRSSPSRTTAYR